MPNIMRIAEHAGVSVATVSRVANGTGYASKETRRKVHEAIADLDYQPNKMASSLRRQESKIVGVLQSDHRTYFNASFAAAVESRLFESGYATMIANTKGSSTMLSEKIEYLLEMRVAGLLIRPNSSSDNIPEITHRLAQKKVATVIVEYYRSMPDRFQVQCGNETGASLSLEHLVSLGHRNVGLIVPSDPRNQYSSHRCRLREAQRFAREHDPCVQLHVAQFDCDSRFEFGRKEARNMLRRTPSITALFCLSDLTAAGAMHGVRDLNLNVPHDVSIVGYDDSYVAKSMRPRLTSVSQPVKALGTAAGAMLIEQIESDDVPPRSLTISPHLAVRESTGPRRTSRC